MPCTPSMLQSLEKLSTALRATDMGSTPLVWLLNCSASVALSDLEAFAEFGHAIGPDKVCAWKHARHAEHGHLPDLQRGTRHWTQHGLPVNIADTQRLGIHQLRLGVLDHMPTMQQGACHWTQHEVHGNMLHISKSGMPLDLQQLVSGHVLIKQSLKLQLQGFDSAERPVSQHISILGFVP